MNVFVSLQTSNCVISENTKLLHTLSEYLIWNSSEIYLKIKFLFHGKHSLPIKKMNHLTLTVQVSSKCLFSELHLKVYILCAKRGLRLLVLNISVWAQRNFMHSRTLKCYSFRQERGECTNYHQCVATNLCLKKHNRFSKT